MPPQLVACGRREFHRITRNSLQAFEVVEQVPPPHIRGGSVARQTVQLDMADPLNLLPLEKGRVLVIARNNLFRYELGQTQSRRYAPIPEPGPLLGWLDPTSPESFWVRTLGSESLSHYALSSLAPSDKTSPSSHSGPGHVQSLPGFDSRLFTLLADGQPLYSTKTGLLRLGSPAGPTPFPKLVTLPTLLFADSSPARYWAADASGNLRLSDLEKGDSPVVTARVHGVVIDVAQEGDRVAVLSLELQGQSYRPSVTIFERGEQRGRLRIGPSVATGVQPQLDLCLIAGRPWVVVGGRHWLQLLDWSAPRLLAEW